MAENNGKKKVYKNLFERQKEEKLEARRKAMEKTKTAPKKDKLEEMYQNLLNMSESDILNRLGEISARKDAIDRTIASLSEKTEEVRERVTANLEKEKAKLEKEETILKSFSNKEDKIAEKIARTREYRNKLIAQRKINKQAAIEALNKAREELKEAEKLDPEKERKVIKAQLDLLSVRYDKLLQNPNRGENFKTDSEKLAKEQNELLNRLDELNNETIAKYGERITELKNKVKSCEKTVKEYETGKSKDDAMINKCNTYWRMLLTGKSPDEISYIVETEEQFRKTGKKVEAKQVEEEIKEMPTEEVKEVPNKEEKETFKVEKKNSETEIDEYTRTKIQEVFDRKEPIKATVTRIENDKESEVEEEVAEEENHEKIEIKEPKKVRFSAILNPDKQFEGREYPEEEAEKEEPEEEEKPESGKEELPVKYGEFSIAHPILAKIPLLRNIAKRIYDRKAYIANTQAELKKNSNPATKQNPETVKQEAKLEEQTTQAISKEPETMSSRRNRFIDYLNESVGDGHKTAGRYTTSTDEQKARVQSEFDAMLERERRAKLAKDRQEQMAKNGNAKLEER